MREMLSTESCRIYEEIGLRELQGGPIRPGGLALTQRAIALSGLPKGSRLLDIGCGAGATIRYLKDACGFDAFGMDPSSLLLAEGAAKHVRIALVRGKGECIPFRDSVLAGVLAECSLSVTEKVEEVLGECWRVLKPGGLLIVNDVYARNPGGVAAVRTLPMECCLVGAVSRDEWASRMEGSGFQVKLWEDHSLALKEFAAQLVFSYGSLEAFWCRSRTGARQDEIRETQRVVARALPGYFLMIAQRG